MTMTETAKPKRGGFTPEMRAKAAATRAAKKQKAAAKPAAQSNEGDGLSKTACYSSCTEKGCIISGQFYCAHPFKGGLQAPQMNDRAALARFARAKDFLATK